MTEIPGHLVPLPGADTLDDVYCVSFVRNLTPDEVLRRFGVDEDTLEEVAFDDLGERSIDTMREDAAGFIGATKAGDWTVVVEPGGWQLAVDPDVYGPVSQGTEVVSICRHDYASDSFAYIVDGTPVVAFDPRHPELPSGADADRFAAEMRATGLVPGGEIDRPIERAFALAERITGLPFSAGLLAQPFLGAETLDD
ncbi:DUF6461 domain-containing protein [Nonomuraea sp. ATR24]|uniref:DUF6461 domain-containing protein n=1 Tax=Nonomuraea TaxID=83681 RepID=UPI001C60466F|nr:DUF6461 domain-containing protein [Nonomuraea ceibae]